MMTYNRFTATPSDRGGLLVAGAGHLVEVYIPSTGQYCKLPGVPDFRFLHTLENMTVCGGWRDGTRTSCLTLTGNGWENTTTLLEWR